MPGFIIFKPVFICLNGKTTNTVHIGKRLIVKYILPSSITQPVGKQAECLRMVKNNGTGLMALSQLFEACAKVVYFVCSFLEKKSFNLNYRLTCSVIDIIPRLKLEKLKIFMVNNDGGDDSDSNKVGLLNAGIDLQLTLSRIDNKFSLTAENLTDGGTASLSIRHPEYLDHRNDIHVGVFGANPFSDVRKTVSIRKFTINIWK